jgi:hypothetical protein
MPDVVHLTTVLTSTSGCPRVTLRSQGPPSETDNSQCRKKGGFPHRRSCLLSAGATVLLEGSSGPPPTLLVGTLKLRGRTLADSYEAPQLRAGTYNTALHSSLGSTEIQRQRHRKPPVTDLQGDHGDRGLSTASATAVIVVVVMLLDKGHHAGGTNIGEEGDKDVHTQKVLCLCLHCERNGGHRQILSGFPGTLFSASRK